jgi:amicyanin
VRAARRAVPGTVLALSVLLGLLSLLASGRASAATYQVTMQGYAFSPATLSVPAGSTVTWTNRDTAPHDVKTTSAPAAFHSPMLNKGGSWSFTFTTPGTYGYYCTVHPNMTARIVVQAAAPKPTPTHEHAASGSSSGHHMTVPSRPTATRSPSSPSPARSMSHPAPAPPTTPAPAATSAPPPVPQTQATASAPRPLDPLLVLTGIVAGVAVLCLLLVGSRASRAREEDA